jgi:RNA polymerase sigma-70 factor (ECF subfamily)
VKRWLIGIAKRELGRYRQCTVRRAPIRRNQVPAAGSEEREPSSAPEERIDLWRAVAELSNVEREILAMKFGAGLGNHEIAEATGLRYVHVGVVLHRALQKLRLRMKCEVDGDGQE